MSFTLTRAIRVLADCLGSSTIRRNAAAATKAVPPSSRCSSKFQTSQIALFEPLEDRTLMSTYYVSPGGNDSASGTSSSSPWKSIAKVSGTHLNAGDQVLFQGGQTFYGSLNLYNDGGSSTSRVVIGSYGSGNATINSGYSDGAWSLNSTGITFQNLNFVGSIGNASAQDGIRIENDSSGTRSGFTVNSCNISGYAGGGIIFGADASNEGLNNVSLTNNDVYNNEETGIESYTVNAESLTDVYIGSNLVHDNYGDGSSVCTGNGIMLQGLNGATVERNSAYNNGAKGGDGGVGIWAYSSNAVVFQYNQSYDNHTTKGGDGDGFDFDSDTSNSIMQYNFSANNDGGGYLLCQWHNDNTESGDIIRYNISQNDGRKNNYSGIGAWGKILNSEIYNNTVYLTPASSGTPSAIRLSNDTITSLHPSNLLVVGNIFITTNGALLVNAEASTVNGAGKILFAGNVYYGSGSATNFSYDGKSYSSLASLQSGSGQEMLNGKSVGLSTNPYVRAAGQAAAQSTAATLSSITAYQLLSNSPVITSTYTATAAALEGTTGASKDFYGDTVQNASLVAGIDQVYTSVGTASVSVSYSQLTGAIIGTAGSYDNDGNTISKVYDGNANTYFDGPTANGNWVGINLGSSKTIHQISFAPRSSFASRMIGGEFQVSNSADFSSGVTTVYTISSSPTVGSLTTITLPTAATGQYVRYLSPNGSYGNISEFDVYG